MSEPKKMLDFLLARLQDEMAAGPVAARETTIKAEIATAPDMARRATAGEQGWEVYDLALRQLVSGYDRHPEYRDAWRP